jgi:hypothetical protein
MGSQFAQSLMGNPKLQQAQGLYNGVSQMMGGKGGSVGPGLTSTQSQGTPLMGMLHGAASTGVNGESGGQVPMARGPQIQPLPQAAPVQPTQNSPFLQAMLARYQPGGA